MIKHKMGKFMSVMMAIATTVTMGATMFPAETLASTPTTSASTESNNYINTTLNTFIHDAADSQVGTAGQDMSLHLRVGYDGLNGLYNPATPAINNVHVRLTNDKNFVSTNTVANSTSKNNPYDEDDGGEAYFAYNEGYSAGVSRSYNTNLGLTYPINGGKYPFEVNSSLTAQEKQIGTLQKNQYVDVAFDVTIRSDAAAGYYAIPITIWYDVPVNSTGNYGSLIKTEFVNVYIEAAGEVKDPATMTKDTLFVVGENQNTPTGTYGSVMNFGVNFRNASNKTVYDVTVKMNTSLDEKADVQNTANSKASSSKQFPFDINESNYDRHFDSVASGETITPPYSMAIKSNAASGFYPLNYVVSYKSTPTATVTASETFTYYVNINNPSMNETETTKIRDFNENDRTKARLIVDSFHTIPDKVYAGQPFQLVFTIKNASESITASNILFSLESEKVSDSPVFTTSGGANSTVVNSLAAGATKELSFTMQAEPGVNPRSYTVVINEKYDSPEYKNAAEKVEIPIDVKQVARLAASGFTVEPSEITVGNQSNVMFGINNTGKVILYNVEASFDSPSVTGASCYVGNIKPGETGNVDVMLTGAKATEDDGTIPITIKYEDVNGEQFTTSATTNLIVTEEETDMSDFDLGADTEQTSGGVNKLAVGGGILAALLAVGIATKVVLKKKKDKENKDETI